jgi:hypothetical protein
LLYHDLPGIRMSGNEYHRDSSLGNNLSGGQAVDYRHVEVDKCDVDLVVVALIDQFFAIANRANYFVAEAFEQPNERLANIGLVFGNGDSYGR